MKPKFAIGQVVTAIGFTDCFHKVHEPIPGLTVAEIRLIEPGCIPNYYRVKAVKDDGSCRYVEGAERYFAAEVQP
jgi:hypothetical protein